MLATKQPLLRKFWYPVMPVAQLDDGPQGFTLLGEEIVLWKRKDGTPAALEGTSTVTLSVSSSHSISSTSTGSPGFLNQVATVASVTLSPRVGTRISAISDQSFLPVSASFTNASCCALCVFARPVAGEAAAGRPE